MRGSKYNGGSKNVSCRQNGGSLQSDIGCNKFNRLQNESLLLSTEN